MALDIILIEHDENNMPPAGLLVAILSDTPGIMTQKVGSPVSSQPCLTDPADILFGMCLASILRDDWAVEDNKALFSVLRNGVS